MQDLEGHGRADGGRLRERETSVDMGVRLRFDGKGKGFGGISSVSTVLLVVTRREGCWFVNYCSRLVGYHETGFLQSLMQLQLCERV